MTPRPLISLHPDDNIAVAARGIAAGTHCPLTTGSDVTARESIELGHKIAVKPIAAGSPVRKFGQTIGYAATDIAAGEWVHVHNVDAGELQLDFAFSSEVRPIPRRSPDGPFKATVAPTAGPRRGITSASSAR
jgi:altronate hydrolase